MNYYKPEGQPLTHIYAEHANEMPVSLRTLYNYIDQGEMTIKNVDLRRKTGYRQRKKGHQSSPGFMNQEYRQCRSYTDFEHAMEVMYTEDDVVEMDTVKGVRESGKRLLTMIFRKNNVMLLFLMPDGKAESVKRVFDYLEAILGLEIFRMLFPVILTDNGSEFKRVDDLELTETYEYRTSLYYCDPMASWQKGCIEKNHEFIRYAIPKGKSLNPYTQEDMTLLMNHINSVKRPGLGNKSPYELVDEEDVVFHELMRCLKMHLISPDEVHLISLLSAAKALAQISEGKDKDAYLNKAAMVRKKLIKYLGENKNTCFDVVYMGQRHQMIEVLKGRYNRDMDFKDTVDLAASLCLDEYFDEKYPGFPVMKTKITEKNRGENARQAIDCGTEPGKRCRGCLSEAAVWV